MQRIEFQLGELLTNLRRNGLLTIAALITVVSAMVVLGLFRLANANIQNLLFEEAKKAQISAFLQDDIATADIDTLRATIAALPDVRDVQYVSPREAFESLAADLDSDMLTALGEEGETKLPAKFNVTPVDPAVIDRVADSVRPLAGIAEVRYAGNVTRILNTLLKQVRLVGYIALALLVLATCAIIGNAIRLTIYARRREIRIMQLVGATDGFVRIPFLMEGLFHGVLGGALAAVVTFVLYQHMAESIVGFIPFLKLIPADSLRVPYAWSLVGTGAAIGLVSAFWSMTAFLREE
ncbi:MAG TPA: hypothetical protein DCZ72_01995 [Armatimonadetes bacterium]|nr:hypothetical protein [Armatimonadota bacterium]